MRDEQVLDDQPEDLGLSEGGKIHWLIIKPIYPIQRPFRGAYPDFQTQPKLKICQSYPQYIPILST